MWPFVVCECDGEICKFERDTHLFANIVETEEVNSQVKWARGNTVTPKLLRKLGYRAYFQALCGFLGCGVCPPPKACLINLIRQEWPEPQGGDDHVGFYDDLEEDGGI
jgi:hypothetical protein